MALQSSGSISASQIRTEFQGSGTWRINAHYRAGARVPESVANINIPTSGEISFSDFYGAANQITLDNAATPLVVNGINSLKEIIVSDYISSGGTLVISSGWWVWSDNTNVAAMTIDIPCTIINDGNIIGRGGDGGGAVQSVNGGPAIKVNPGVTNVTITNSAGSYIAGGGGGGGGAGGGGAGGGNGSRAGRYDGLVPGYSPNGGSLGQPGGSGNLGPSAGGVPSGGGAGGGGGNDADPRPTWGGYHGGGGGGRVLPGTGGAGGANSVGNRGGDGGSANNPGSNGWGGGGGGWAAQGGNNGGTGGAAIDGSVTSLTNNGTIWGSIGTNLATVATPTMINGNPSLQEIIVSDFINSGETLFVPSDWWIWSDNISVAAMTVDIPCTIINNGKVIGKGGRGGDTSVAENGGPAIKINSSISNVTILNETGAFIAGGGGGGAERTQTDGTSAGGGGAGGGAGGTADGPVGATGGTVGAVGGTNFGGVTAAGAGGAGGGQGGGRILPGVAGSLSTSGFSNATDGGGGGNPGGDGAEELLGATTYTIGAGGGGWGAAGGGPGTGALNSTTGGSGGAAINDSGNTYTLSNSGTIYGTT